MLNKITGQEVDRRLLLKGAAAGGLGIAGATMLAGCASDASGPVNFGVRTVDESPVKQANAIIDPAPGRFATCAERGAACASGAGGAWRVAGAARL